MKHREDGQSKASHSMRAGAAGCVVCHIPPFKVAQISYPENYTFGGMLDIRLKFSAETLTGKALANGATAGAAPLLMAGITLIKNYGSLPRVPGKVSKAPLSDLSRVPVCRRTGTGGEA